MGSESDPILDKIGTGTRGYDSEKLDCGWLRSVGHNCALTAVKIGIAPNASDVLGSFLESTNRNHMHYLNLYLSVYDIL